MSQLPDDQNPKPNTPNQTQALSQTTPTSGVHKEAEPIIPSESNMIEETGTEIELEPEVETSGIERKSDTIELPPDVENMGVEAVGPTQPLGTGSTVQLPLDDTQIVQGLHGQIISSLRWLAEWCVKQLKKAHLHLRVMAGKVVREKD